MLTGFDVVYSRSYMSCLTSVCILACASWAKSGLIMDCYSKNENLTLRT